MFAAALAKEVERDGIAVHVVTTGPVATPMLDDVHFPMRTLGVDDVAQAVVWLDTLPGNVVLPGAPAVVGGRGPVRPGGVRARGGPPARPDRATRRLSARRRRDQQQRTAAEEQQQDRGADRARRRWSSRHRRRIGRLVVGGRGRRRVGRSWSSAGSASATAVDRDVGALARGHVGGAVAGERDRLALLLLLLRTEARLAEQRLGERLVVGALEHEHRPVGAEHDERAVGRHVAAGHHGAGQPAPGRRRQRHRAGRRRRSSSPARPAPATRRRPSSTRDAPSRLFVTITRSPVRGSTSSASASDGPSGYVSSIASTPASVDPGRDGSGLRLGHPVHGDRRAGRVVVADVPDVEEVARRRRVRAPRPCPPSRSPSAPSTG